MSLKATIGIDFGTTNSLCAWMDGGTPVVIPNSRGERLTPSVFALSGKGERLVGNPARNQALANPGDAVFAVKRSLGGKATFHAGGSSWTPEAVAAEILSAIRRDAENFLGLEVSAAVITAPARFSDPQRRALKEAAAKAGLETRRILNEPTAAALARAYARSPGGMLGGSGGEDVSLLVYDFGGGTFDASLLSVRKGACRVIASEGDDRLGGIDMDARLYSLAAAEFRARFDFDPDADPFAARVLLDACEKAKIELSTRLESVIAIPFLRNRGALVHPSVVVTRGDLERIAQPLVERTVSLVERLLAGAGRDPRGIDALVLSGGMSRMPLVAATLGRLVPLEPDRTVNPDEIVAIGAAVEAARLEGRIPGFSLTDVVSRTFGLEIDKGRYLPLITRNMPLPAMGRRIFTTIDDWQASVELHVMQGESARSSGNVSLGRFLLPGIRQARKGEPRIAVNFDIDESDLLRVSARDLDTGTLQSVVFSDEPGFLSPLDHLALLSSRLERSVSAADVDAAFSGELADLIAESTRCVRARDAEAARRLSPLVESCLGELMVRTGVRET